MIVEAFGVPELLRQVIRNPADGVRVNLMVNLGPCARKFGI